MTLLFSIVFLFYRHEDIGDALARYIAHARQCPVALFFRLFHLWHRRCPTLGRNPPAEMLPRSTQGHRPTSNFVSGRLNFFLSLFCFKNQK